MTAKEIKNNNDIQATDDEVILDVKIPATGVDVVDLIPELVENKVTPGRKMRGDPARRGGRSGSTGNKGGNRGSRGSGRSENRERAKPEFDSKIIDIRRVTRVASGGRRYSFSVAVVAGDKKGRVGVGLGKGSDTALAVEKATREARKNLIKVPLSAQMTIAHQVEGKYGSARIIIFPARGRGTVAGSSARVVLELAGVRDVCSKFLSGSKNRLNNARATITALQNLTAVPRIHAVKVESEVTTEK